MLGGAAGRLINGGEKRTCWSRFKFLVRMLLKGTVMNKEEDFERLNLAFVEKLAK